MGVVEDVKFEDFHLHPFRPGSSQQYNYEEHLRPFRKVSVSEAANNNARPARGVSDAGHSVEPPQQARPSSSNDEKSLAEKSRTRKFSPSSSGNASESQDGGSIVWHYLTYETDLPQPTQPTPAAKADCEIPEAPDLTPYRNPLEWSSARKSALVWISTVATTITAYTAGAYAPGVGQMSAEWNLSRVVAFTGVLMFTAGFGIAPMILAPFSELNGRRPIFLVTGALFLIFDLCCGLTRAFAGMLVSRFFVGAASSTFSTMVGGVIADIYVTKDRNTPMTIFTGGVLFGTGLGPLVSAFIAQHISWRWIYYVHSILVGALFVVLIFFFDETRGSVLLSRKAAKLNTWYEAREAAGYYGFDMVLDGLDQKQSQRIRWKVKADEERTSLGQMIKISLIRPFHLLFTEPVVFFFSLWISFAWSILYCTFSVIPYTFETLYGFSLQESGAVFASIAIAAIFATFLCIYQEKIAAHYGKLPATPEGRLMFTCVESALVPVALFWFGWTASPSIPWIVPALAIGFATVGVFSVYLAVFNYFADTYHRYASSAIAAQSFCRNLMAGAFPLFTQQMFEKLGFGGAGSLLGAIGVVLTFVPWILMFFGPQIRARSKFASEIMSGKQY